VTTKSYKHPLAATLDKLVEENRQIREDEAAYVKGEELGRVPGAQLQAHLGLVGMSEAGIFHLAGDLIYSGDTVSRGFRLAGCEGRGGWGGAILPRACAASNNLASAAM